MPRFKFFFFVFLLPLLLIAGVSIAFNWDKEFVEVKLGNRSIMAEVARTPHARVMGLSGREKLQEGAGMIFVFDGEGYHGIWMKEMNFPIDILWLGDGKVVDFVEGASPQGDTPAELLPVYTPDSPAEYVLQVNSGFIEQYGIKVGSEARAGF